MRRLLAVLTLATATAIPALALAATPKFPATFLGGGAGSPVEFTLNKKGKVTDAFFAFTCKNHDGIASAHTDKKHRPRGKVENGKITITYLSKPSREIGTVKATIKVTFTSKTRAKGTTSIEGGNCKKPPKGHFTAGRRGD
jgi:hypothetical protein